MVSCKVIIRIDTITEKVFDGILLKISVQFQYNVSSVLFYSMSVLTLRVNLGRIFICKFFQRFVMLRNVTLFVNCTWKFEKEEVPFILWCLFRDILGMSNSVIY